MVERGYEKRFAQTQHSDAARSTNLSIKKFVDVIPVTTLCKMQSQQILPGGNLSNGPSRSLSEGLSFVSGDSHEICYALTHRGCVHKLNLDRLTNWRATEIRSRLLSGNSIAPSCRCRWVCCWCRLQASVHRRTGLMARVYWHRRSHRCGVARRCCCSSRTLVVVAVVHSL